MRRQQRQRCIGFPSRKPSNKGVGGAYAPGRCGPDETHDSGGRGVAWVAAVRLGLPDPQQPARPCLLTRFDYGDAPDARRLRLTQQVEDFLSELPELKAGFRLRWLGEKPLLHVASANGSSSEDLQSIQTRLAERFPELNSVHIEVMDNLSGWFDRRREVADAQDRAPERLM